MGQNHRANLTILIVNYNSSDFVANSLYALSKLTKNTYKVFILDNNSDPEDYRNLKNYLKKHQNVFLERQQTKLTGSMAHGTVLNYLVKKVDTPYFSILDADSVWLGKSWDEILIGELTDKTKLIGTQASPPKPQDFPLMYAIFFETSSFQTLHIDFRPKDTKHYQDTGWELREKYLEAGFNGKVIEMKNTRIYKDGPFRDLIVAEYYLNKDYKNIFASHFGRGSTLGVEKYKRSGAKVLTTLPFVGGHLLRRRGLGEKKRWIQICREIIDSQTR